MSLVDFLKSKNFLAQDEKPSISRLRTVLREYLQTVLTKEQYQAFSDMLNFCDVEDGNKFLMLGYAGVGKTFVLNWLIAYIIFCRPYTLKITAPTNKAAAVIRNNLKSNEFMDDNVIDLLEVNTLHSLLKIKMSINSKGECYFDTKKVDTEALTSYLGEKIILIVDECSMIDETIYNIIDSLDIKIIFVGDPCQIPPVNKTESIVFKNKSKAIVTELTQIMRQSVGNPIIAKSKAIRDNIREANCVDYKTELIGTQGIIYYTQGKKEEFFTRLSDTFCSREYKEDINHAKVISWTNDSVNNINKLIHRLRFGPAARIIMPGEYVTTLSPCFTKPFNGDDERRMIANTNSDFIIKNIIEDFTLPFVYKNKKHEIDMDVKFKTVHFTATDLITNEDVIFDLIKDCSKHEWHRCIEFLKNKAISAKVPSEKVKLWKVFYTLKEINDNLNYSYSITAHRSQGSTYKNVFLIESDIDKNKDIYERNRIKYTAYTRAKENLYIML